MNAFQFCILIFVTISAAFMVFMFWYYYENYDYIIEFNKKYKNLEYSSSPDINYVDTSTQDPNDNVLDVKNKIRCVKEENRWIALSKNGFVSDSSTSIEKKFTYKEDCEDYIFLNKSLIIFNPCIEGNNYLCRKLQSFL